MDIKKEYKRPEVQVIQIEMEGIIADSTPSSRKNPGGVEVANTSSGFFSKENFFSDEK